ncbi:hypothetical protein DPMN_157074 [Dreissena polymorpha]|uniref:Uncharacterized protein n=1 Tax=Dreissena polymorpha TaxID=45954 RepID=A0A9D4EER6_DREPO|nr:hypothetical protein DPMN_157074 [Dreissena polymorpha]
MNKNAGGHGRAGGRATGGRRACGRAGGWADVRTDGRAGGWTEGRAGVRSGGQGGRASVRAGGRAGGWAEVRTDGRMDGGAVNLIYKSTGHVAELRKEVLFLDASIKHRIVATVWLCISGARQYEGG